MCHFNFRAVRVAACLLFLWVGAGIGANSASATPIASIPVRFTDAFPFDIGTNEITDTLTYSVWVDPASDPFPDIGDGFLLAQFILTNGDLGKTLTASALNIGSSFNSAAALLTNSSLFDFISVTAFVPSGGGSGDGGAELGLLDLRGATLGSLKLSVEQLSFTSPGQNPNGDGRWTDVLFYGHLVFDTDAPTAQLPEPGTMALLLAGLGLLAYPHRRRRLTAQ